MSDPILYSVDRSWSNYRGSRISGDLAPSDTRKYHVDRGDSTAKCSPRILLNSLKGDAAGERLSEIRETGLVCRRCVPGWSGA